MFRELPKCRTAVKEEWRLFKAESFYELLAYVDIITGAVADGKKVIP